MSAPLYDALAAAAGKDMLRLHMPGHKGRPVAGHFGEVAALDVTELSYSGNLYTEERGPIREAEALWAEACGAKHCLFLTGGATQGILALFAAFARPGDTVILDRGAHRSVHNAVALLDLRPVWLRRPRLAPFGVEAALPPATVEAALDAHPDAAFVFVTDPTYYGVLSDLDAVAAVCRARNIPFLLDAAHGAQLLFLSGAPPADAAVFSAHKTLPALGQAAFVLLRDAAMAARVRGMTAVFGTSSPSYPIMASMDLARAHMLGEGREALTRVVSGAETLRRDFPHFLTGGDPTRLCLYTGRGFSDALRLEERHGVACEMADRYNIVFLLSCADDTEALARLRAALEALFSARLVPLPARAQTPPPDLPERGLPAREALFAPREPVPLGESAGRVAAELLSPYPPGVPAVSYGEKIDKNSIDFLGQMGYTEGDMVYVVL